MRMLEFFVLLVFLSTLMLGLYFLWLNFPTEVVEFEEYRARVSQDLPLESTQFFPNMRYPTHILGYVLAKECDPQKREDFKEALRILSSQTILVFYESSNPDISVLCSDVSPRAEQRDYFIAGEGGPTEIINTTKYNVILHGEISLYRGDDCETPQVALHELLHALGFNHNGNQESIMYPITNCQQIIDSEIVEEINRLYSEPSLGDIVIESVSANKTGRYLNFKITITNDGLVDMGESILELAANGEQINTYEIGPLEIGTKRFLSVMNQRVPRELETITFTVETPELEITKENNFAEIITAI